MKTLFDFQSPARAGVWQVVNDDVMGGCSHSRFEVAEGLAVFSGELSLENNGGFASVRSAPARFDLDGCAAFVLELCGDGRRYKFTARMESGFDSPLYQCVFETKPGAWEEHRLPMDRFVPTFRGRRLTDQPRLNASRVVSVGFLIAEKQEGPFRLQIRAPRAV